MEMKSKFSTLWLFASLNYIYCDILGLMNPSMLKGFIAGNVAGIDITQGFLLASGVLVEIPMAMVLLSRILGYRANRVANIVAGVVMTAVQLGSNFVGAPAPYYVFFSIFEIATTAAIVWFAWTWRHELRSSSVQTEALRAG
jgi:uncharacterized protein DUF6326